MKILEKLPPEILIYLQKIRKFVTTNEESKKYFKIDTHGERFFKELTEMCQDNFEKTGDAELSVAQFEELRLKVINNKAIKGIFMDLGDFGLISLN